MNVERNKQIYAMRESGARYAEIARNFKLSRNQIAQICYKVERHRKAEARRERNAEGIDSATVDQIAIRLQQIVAELRQLDAAFRNGVCDHLTPDDLLLSTRCRNCLKNEGITSIRQLLDYSPAELLRTPNFGQVSLDELTAELARWGIPFPFPEPS